MFFTTAKATPINLLEAKLLEVSLGGGSTTIMTTDQLQTTCCFLGSFCKGSWDLYKQ